MDTRDPEEACTWAIVTDAIVMVTLTSVEQLMDSVL